METPEIKVGIYSNEKISFALRGQYSVNGIKLPEGDFIASLSGEKLSLHKDEEFTYSDEHILLEPKGRKDSYFTLRAVTIGVDFHWQRTEDQVFRGKLRLMAYGSNIIAINILSLEDYLESVISSEMSGSSSEELLKAHAVISRSWLLAQIVKGNNLVKEEKKYNAHFRTEKEIVKWYDREDHTNFDVCADDHCQRYQGITRASSPTVAKVIKATCGEVLSYEGAICDARYSKCCGGITEKFENVWEPVVHPYLQKVNDNTSQRDQFDLNPLDESSVREWILGNPEAFCNTTDNKVLSQVLNDYDQETNDFYRWSVIYSQDLLSELVKKKTGFDFGKITDITPLERGSSGRIIRLEIKGTRRTMVIGKELEIRKALSKSHLYSSCFIVEKSEESNEVQFLIRGAGWGHGVGLCQIGAAVMGSKGYSYREILMHYFRGAELEKKY
jgi:stage II sporulation protein D